MFNALKKPYYLLIAAAVFVLLSATSFSLAVRSSISLALTLPVESFGKRLALLSASVQAIPLNLSASSILYILVISLLAGINISLLVYYFRTRAKFYKKSSLGFLGVLSGIVGVGCASCGSILLSSAIGLSAGAAVAGWLPLGGAEFSLLAISLLFFSIFSLSKKLQPEKINSCEL